MADESEVRTVAVAHTLRESGAWNPTTGRWLSFGWAVVSDPVRPWEYRNGGVA